MTTAKEWKREIVPARVRVESNVSLPADRETWLNELAIRHWLTTSLAHHDDGVNWGMFKNGAWRWSHDAQPNVSPAFRWETLQQLRCFGAKAEMFVWRVGDGFSCRIIKDVDDSAGVEKDIKCCFDEDVLLWGHGRDLVTQDDFALMREGSRGIRHAPPADIAARGYVTFRHYLMDDENGCARVVASRLVV